MAKKIRKLTDQEALVTAFSHHSISRLATFHPLQWSSGNEPADMIILVGRALLFINMTRSNSYFENLCDHNINQARDRIAEWAEGKPIRGRNKWNTFSIAYEDIDFLAVISVVDGPHALCARHNLQAAGLDLKVKICFSITSDVLRRIAELNGGARDVIHLGLDLGEVAVSSFVALAAVDSRYMREVLIAEALLPAAPKLYCTPKRSFFRQIWELFSSIRVAEIGNCEDFAELNWSDISALAAFASVNTAAIENLRTAHLLFKTFGEEPKYGCILSDQMKGMADWTAGNIARLSPLSFFISFSFLGQGMVLPMVVDNPENHLDNTARLLASL